MKAKNSHLGDQQLLLAIEGELAARDEKTVRLHLEECWKCRVRRQELERAIAGFVHVHEQEFAGKLAAGAGPRALLKAQLAQVGSGGRAPYRNITRLFAAAACALVALSVSVAGLVYQGRSAGQIVSIPDSTLTPGAALLESRQTVCSQPNTKNKTVPATLQRKVFEEYRIKAAEPRAYEVDYLITPALGGAEDIHNLWPHSYAATAWNARVKDDLEDRLREMVCDGSLDLATAQHEIAGNWIAAYKKYFQTDQPLRR